MEWLLWSLGALILGIIELLTLDFTCLMLAVAACATASAAFLGAPVWGQILIFCAASTLLLVLIRPWARKYLDRHTPRVRMNVHGLVGQEVRVHERVDHSNGRVFLAGSIWSARTNDDIPLMPDTVAYVVSIEGATAVVSAVRA
ncbi:NfeD family protein [Schaalia sp. lx-100]|uniref:NfeD family protein n=1 Tax=Schaalia sp. lx-100 TaxID=2899081 RepID=UPI001E500D54|nr:NfeD family protein [Schaalia sp. lx-100]MCD4557371.1 NfeD family protein [Schaalia sp. lx-100]